LDAVRLVIRQSDKCRIQQLRCVAAAFGSREDLGILKRTIMKLGRVFGSHIHDILSR
jgi:hypothetical protein